MITDKIQPYHLAKQAYVYLRQSSISQVRFNQESTQRQYALQDKAQQMGWSPTTIRILDGDLGISGTQSTNREDFKTLVADVSMGKVGAVFALEASRLSRSCADWHRLLELCAMVYHIRQSSLDAHLCGLKSPLVLYGHWRYDSSRSEADLSKRLSHHLNYSAL